MKNFSDVIFESNSMNIRENGERIVILKWSETTNLVFEESNDQFFDPVRIQN